MYDELIALHYAAYRPKLHEVLLAKCLKPNQNFSLGLDIGCGTGRSSVSLSAYCNSVIALDPSASMLQQAENHPQVRYIQMKVNLDIPEYMFDIITFAGSLFYCKSQDLVDKLVPLCSQRAIILVYDFNIHLEEILLGLGLNTPIEIDQYNHFEDFSGLKTNHFIELGRQTETISYPISLNNLVHFLLSHSSIYQNLVEESGRNKITRYLSMKLAVLPKTLTRNLKADLYYQKYEVIKTY